MKKQKSIKENSKRLIDYYPEYAKDFDTSKNTDVDLAKLTVGSSKILVDWKCHKCGYEWKQKVCYRVRYKTECKNCSNQENLLKFSNPELLEEWDYDKNTTQNPNIITKGSNENIWWKCKECQNSWQQPVYVRIKLKSTCKYCQIKDTLFTKTHPHLLEEWDWEKNKDLDPHTLVQGSGKKVWWICKKCGNSFNAPIDNRTIRNQCCGKCRDRNKKNPFFHEIMPELLEDWDWDKNVGIDPYILTTGSNKKVWWKCKNNHSYQSEVYYKTQGAGCSYCKGLRVDESNSLLSLRPDICEEWDYEKNILLPSEIPCNAHRKVWWKCKNSHSFEAIVFNRTRKTTGGTKCPYCVGRTATSENNFSVLFPDYLNEWDYEKNLDINPYELRPACNKKVWWKCSKNHSWNSVLQSRAKGNGCPYCAGNLTAIENSIGTLKPEFLKEWDWDKNKKLDPYKLSMGSDVRVWWQCEENKEHFWRTSVAHRVEGTGCPYCAGINILLRRYIDRLGLNDDSRINLYRLILFNEKECFYKVGVTIHKVEQRFRRLLPDTGYKIVVISLVSDILKVIIDLEQTTHKKVTRKLDDNLIRYKPSKYFGGIGECYILPEELEIYRAMLNENYEYLKAFTLEEEIKSKLLS